MQESGCLNDALPNVAGVQLRTTMRCRMEIIVNFFFKRNQTRLWRLYRGVLFLGAMKMQAENANILLECVIFMPAKQNGGDVAREP